MGSSNVTQDTAASDEVLEEVMTLVQHFDRDATRAAVLYIAQKVSEPTFHKVGKILYLADLKHIQEFGRQMFGETYKAMPHGPVPSNAYTTMTTVRDNPQHSDQEGYTVAKQKVRGNDSPAPVICPTTDPDMRHLAPFAVESLDWATDHFGDMTFRELCQLTHDEMWTRIRRESPQNDAPIISIEELARKALGEDAEVMLSDPFPSDDLVHDIEWGTF